MQKRGPRHVDTRRSERKESAHYGRIKRRLWAAFRPGFGRRGRRSGCSSAAQAGALDVSDMDSVLAVMREYGPFDIVVNNAGTTAPGLILDQTEEDYNAVLNTNLAGVWRVGKEAARGMKDAGIAGSIINIASITGLRQAYGNAPYSVSKAGVIHMTKQMALEFARHKIRVNAIAPGYFETDMTREFIESERGQSILKNIPLRRLGDYQSLSGLLLLLASDECAFMTGSIIPVDGGHLLSSL